MILSYLLQQIYTISDAAIVGQTLSAGEVAGVNDTTSIVAIFLQFAFGVSAGFCVVTSSRVGARDQAGVRRSLTTQIVLSAALTVLLTALALVLLNPLLAWINVTPDSPEIYRAAFTYCAIIFGGTGAQLFYNFICSFLRSLGDSVTPLLFLLFSTVLNIGARPAVHHHIPLGRRGRGGRDGHGAACEHAGVLCLRVCEVPGAAPAPRGLAYHALGSAPPHCAGHPAWPAVFCALRWYHRDAGLRGEVRHAGRGDGLERGAERFRCGEQGQHSHDDPAQRPRYGDDELHRRRISARAARTASGRVRCRRSSSWSSLRPLS